MSKIPKLMFIVALIVVAALSAYFLSSRPVFKLPDKLGSYSLYAFQSGKEAVEEIKRIHESGWKINIENGYIAVYTGPSGK